MKRTSKFLSLLLALAMVCSLFVPAMAEEISAFAATSNIMTNVTGLYMDLFVALPCANFLYKLLVRKSSR